MPHLIGKAPNTLRQPHELLVTFRPLTSIPALSEAQHGWWSIPEFANTKHQMVAPNRLVINLFRLNSLPIRELGNVTCYMTLYSTMYMTLYIKLVHEIESQAFTEILIFSAPKDKRTQIRTKQSTQTSI